MKVLFNHCFHPPFSTTFPPPSPTHTHSHTKVLLDNGILLTFTVAKHSGDVERILIDKTLIVKLQAKADHGETSCSFLLSPPSSLSFPHPLSPPLPFPPLPSPFLSPSLISFPPTSLSSPPSLPLSHLPLPSSSLSFSLFLLFVISTSFSYPLANLHTVNFYSILAEQCQLFSIGKGVWANNKCV